MDFHFSLSQDTHTKPTIGVGLNGVATCRITDVGLTHINKIPLHSIKLSMCKVTNLGIARLNPCLQYIDAQNCPLVTTVVRRSKPQGMEILL